MHAAGTRSSRRLRPVVTLHFAQSLDGRLGLGRELPRTRLSSREGEVQTHRARHEHDAVLIGIDTALHDDPLLTARGQGETQPLRVVLDSELRLPAGARLFAAGASAGPVVIFGNMERASASRLAELEAAGVDARLVPGDGSGRVSLGHALEQLAERGVRHLLVEGGSKVLSSFLRARLADRAIIEIAPVFLGAPGTSAVGELGIGHVDQAPRLLQPSLERWGESLCLRGVIAYATSEP